MRKITVILGLLFMLGLVPSVKAQNHDMPTMVNPTITIDGATNPELFSDTEVYFAVANAFGNPALDSGDVSRKAILKQRFQDKLTDAEIDAVLSIFEDFRTNLDKATADFNTLATSNDAKGIATDPSDFYAKINTLLQKTRSLLALNLQPSSLVSLHSFVLGEKSFMRKNVVSQ